MLSDKLKLNNFKITDEHNIRIYESQDAANGIVRALALNDVEISAFGIKKESLENYFLKLTEGEETSC